MRLMTLLVIGLLVISIGVIAAGSSTGGQDTSQDNQQTKSTEQENQQTQPSTKNCDEMTGLQARIKCRMEKEKPEPETPEACQNIERKQGCITLYQNSENCYKMRGKNKDKCFKQNAGIGQSISQTARENPQAIRNYVVLLLYDLQERIEKAQANGEISTEQASKLIATIVEIKQDTMSDASPQQIQSKVKTFKSNYKQVMS